MRWLIFFVPLCLSACAGEPIEWGDVSYRHSQLGDAPAVSARRDANLPQIPGTVAACIRSVVSTFGNAELFRAWWAVRSDSNAVLSLQRSADGGQTWQPPVEADARDRGSRGCDRPKPAVSYHAASHYVYLAYFLDARDGSGVFFAHSMDDGKMFHSPVPVVYGNYPAEVAVDGHGDSVVVVFEDPNAVRRMIGYVLSHTTGHIFDQRGEVTPPEIQARSPWVLLKNDRIRVWWMTPDSLDRVGYREGAWR